MLRSWMLRKLDATLLDASIHPPPLGKAHVGLERVISDSIEGPFTGGSSGPFFWGGGGQVMAEGPNLPPFSSFSSDLGHFILKLLKVVLIYVNFLSLFSRLGGKQATLGLWGAWP